MYQPLATEECHQIFLPKRGVELSFRGFAGRPLALSTRDLRSRRDFAQHLGLSAA